MIVFKYFFQVLKKYISTIFLFTAMLIIFGVFSLQSNQTSMEFTASKPAICIINEDEMVGITKGLYEYLAKNANIKEVPASEEAKKDALFYREVNYMIFIPQGFHQEFIEGKNPLVEVQSSGDYQASLAEILLNNYLQTASVYLNSGISEEEIVDKVDQVLEQKAKVQMTSTLDNNGLEHANNYYNFANYSILSICIYVVAVIMSSFRKEMIQKRMKISCLKNKKYNKFIFLGILVLGIVLWAVYYFISVILVKDVMFTIHGMLYALNSFIFTICALSIAFLIGNILSKKETISGITNVIGLGSSFLCGSFVAVQFLPDFVLKIAHVLPSYWYIQNNELIKSLEKINLETLKPFMINLGVVVLFTIVFLMITNIYTKRKRYE